MKVENWTQLRILATRMKDWQQKMKWGLIVVLLLLLLQGSCIMAYADTIITTGGTTVESAITGEEIAQSVQISNANPVALQLEGVVIQTETPPVIIRGRVLIPARTLFEAMGGTVEWNDVARTVTIRIGSSNCLLTVDSNKALVNGVEKELEVPALIVDTNGDGIGSTMVPVRFVTEALQYQPIWNEEQRIVNIVSSSAQGGEAVAPGGYNQVNSSTSTTVDTPDTNSNNQGGTTAAGVPILNTQLAGKVVVIDAGHGGTDPGKVGDEQGQPVLEKEVNLAVALKLNEYLQSAGVSTYMMRDNDVAVELQDRPKRANEAYGHLFVSVHHNSFTNSQVGGTETYYYLKDSEKEYGLNSKTLAEFVQKEVVNTLHTRDRGVKSEPEYAVLNKTKMPAILVEVSFLTNPEELKQIQTDSYKDQVALAIAKGIINTLNASVSSVK